MGRKRIFSPEMEEFIEQNYRTMSDIKISNELRKRFLVARTDSQIKHFREKNSLSKYESRTSSKQKPEDSKRITVRGAVTTHRCL